ncbi:MAG: hypothetical protein ACJ73S_30620 [Mycobacteriales bacterium]
MTAGRSEVGRAAPAGYALSFAAGWCPVDPDPDTAPAAVAALVRRMPEFAPHAGYLAQVLAAGCVQGDAARAEIVALVAAPLADRCPAGMMFVRIGPNPYADLEEALADAERDLGGRRIDGIAEADVVSLASGLPAVRVHRLREAPGADGTEPVRVLESLGYLIPAPGGELMALLEFATAELDVGELLVLAADVVAGSFEWKEAVA